MYVKNLPGLRPIKAASLEERTSLIFRSVNYPQPKHEMAIYKYQVLWHCSHIMFHVSSFYSSEQDSHMPVLPIGNGSWLTLMPKLCIGIVWESASWHALSLCQGLFEHFYTQFLDRLFPMSMHVPFMLHFIETPKAIFSKWFAKRKVRRNCGSLSRDKSHSHF